MQCALAALLATSVASHGLMSWPRQRGAAGRNNYDMPHLDKDPGYVADDCPHCLNGGGKGVVQSHSKGMWVPFEPTYPDMPFRDDHEICGDPIGDNSHKVGGKYTTGMMLATYEDGDYMDMEIQINAHHNGYMEFLLCNMDACDSDDISKKCFQSGACEKLMRVPHKSCESGNDRICGPVDPAYPGRWILPPRNQDAPEDNWYGGTNKKMRYALPKGMVCEKCVRLALFIHAKNWLYMGISLRVADLAPFALFASTFPMFSTCNTDLELAVGDRQCMQPGGLRRIQVSKSMGWYSG